MANKVEKAQSKKAAATKPKRTRSPNYPSLDLKTAVDKLPDLFVAMKRHSVGVEVAVSKMGYSHKSSTGMLALAAMRAYGLFESERNGAEAMVKLSTTALYIATDYPRDSNKWREAVKKAALTPNVHSQLWNKYGASLPADDEVRRYLARELKFNDNAVGPFIEEYKTTIAFAKLSNEDIIEGEAGNSDIQHEGNMESTAERQVVSGERLPAKPNLPVPKGIKEDVYTTDVGDYILRWPEKATPEIVEEFEEWVGLMLKKIKRVSASSDGGEQ